MILSGQRKLKKFGSGMTGQEIGALIVVSI